MKTIFEHIEHVKGKPHHIRKRVAFMLAGCGAGLVALVWLVSSLNTGAFAIRGASFADSVGQGTVEVGTESADSGLAGVASALPSAAAPAHIEIIDTASSTRPAKQAEQTTIPF